MLKKYLKLFNKKSIINIFIIFIVGFVIRIIINYVYNIKVFIDYTNIVSIVYYYSFKYANKKLKGSSIIYKAIKKI